MVRSPRVYKEKPLLRIVEAYVLDVIGELDVKTQDWLGRLEPELRRLYKVDGSWRSVVEQILHLPNDAREKIQVSWRTAVDRSADAGHMLTPAEFAVIYTDKFFLDESR